ncbi:MAG: four helix bundle protein [candidate division KSB1 bacterium]|nr:four helix bundle protein [candidate division KSB1 bacterium]
MNIAEGSRSQRDAEFSRFMGTSIRPLVETVACHHLIERRPYAGLEMFAQAYAFPEGLFAKLQLLTRFVEANR